jgi:hypothetical protein
LVSVLAPADPTALHAQAQRADVVVGVHGGEGPEAALAVADRVRESLPEHAAVLLLEPAEGALGELVRARPQGGHAALAVRRPDPREGPLEALLRAADDLDAQACALVSADPRPDGSDGVSALLRPVLEGRHDLVWPVYVRHKLEGGLHTGIGAPFVRAVFGRRLRQPIVSELALSRSLARHLLRDEELRTDPSHGGADVLLLVHGVPREFKVCQAVVGPAPAPPTQTADVSDTLARMARLLFHEAHRHAAQWQRVRSSESVPISGALPAVVDDARAFDAERLVESFSRGFKELQRLWAAVLPPQTLLALKRLAHAHAGTFRLDDALWARIVFDFAVAYHWSTMERGALLRSMAPLYLGWMASWAQEIAPLDGARVEERADALSRAFELERPYLIARWRWPDRFAP